MLVAAAANHANNNSANGIDNARSVSSVVCVRACFTQLRLSTRSIIYHLQSKIKLLPLLALIRVDVSESCNYRERLCSLARSQDFDLHGNEMRLIRFLAKSSLHIAKFCRSARKKFTLEVSLSLRNDERFRLFSSSLSISGISGSDLISSAE